MFPGQGRSREEEQQLAADRAEKLGQELANKEALLEEPSSTSSLDTEYGNMQVEIQNDIATATDNEPPTP